MFCIIEMLLNCAWSDEIHGMAPGVEERLVVRL